MKPKDQEILFQRVKDRYPEWTDRQCSGYVAGVVDEARYTRPEHRQTLAFTKLERTYAKGYVLGFVDARGSDAFTDPWLKKIAACIRHSLAFQWWINEQ